MLNDSQPKVPTDTSIERRDYRIDNTKVLNRFFMRKVSLSIFSTVLMFAIIIFTLVAIINFFQMDDTIRISIISSLVTFIITTGKSIIDKFTYNLQYITTLLSEEQIGINKSLGISISDIPPQMTDNEQKGTK